MLDLNLDQKYNIFVNVMETDHDQKSEVYKMGKYHAYIPGLRPINSSDWMGCSGFSLADAKKSLHYDDLVEDKGPTELIFLPSEMDAARLRAEMMDEKYEDLVVTLVAKITYNKGQAKGTLRVESLRHSQVVGRVHELKEQVIDGTVKIMMVYSEETHQLFCWNDLMIDEMPRMPGYGKETDRKRTAYRNSSSGV